MSFSSGCKHAIQTRSFLDCQTGEKYHPNMRSPSILRGSRDITVIRAFLILTFVLVGCDHGFEPPDKPSTGMIRATVTYTGTWPSLSEVVDLRFVAMRFVPQDTADFLQLNRMAISDRLNYGVDSETIVLTDVETGAFLYSGIAQQFTNDLLSWRPLGLYAENDGVFFVISDDTVRLAVEVDFSVPPPFPPPPF